MIRARSRPLSVVLFLVLILPPAATAAPGVEPWIEGGENRCAGEGSNGRETAEGEEWRWSNSTFRCEARYSRSGAAVVNDGETLAWVAVDDRQQSEETQRYDHHDDLDWYACESGECSDSRAYDNETRSSRWHRGQGVETSHTSRVELTWCDGEASDSWTESTQTHGDHGLLLDRDTYHHETAQSHESCRYGARGAGVEESALRCDQDAAETLDYEEHYRPDTGVTWDGAGTTRRTTVCLLGVWRDADAGVARAGVRAGYEETRRDCYPACGPTTEEALVARAYVEPAGGERAGVDERQDVDAPTRVMT